MVREYRKRIGSIFEQLTAISRVLEPILNLVTPTKTSSGFLLLFPGSQPSCTQSFLISNLTAIPQTHRIQVKTSANSNNTTTWTIILWS